MHLASKQEAPPQLVDESMWLQLRAQAAVLLVQHVQQHLLSACSACGQHMQLCCELGVMGCCCLTSWHSSMKSCIQVDAMSASVDTC